MALAGGTRLGPYEVVSSLGAGGMGEVYRARDTKLGRDVALKILPDAFVNDPERLARFGREARTLASLNHPNIAQIHGLEDSGPIRALVLELVEGPTLADRLSHGPLPADEAIAIARQVALALEAAHEQGIVHRDLKPANIKVKPDGTVKVLDFGLAKAMEPVSTTPARDQPTMTSPAMTAMGMILGTAAYMSPEQARGRPVDRRADIWAFGCVLYEMLTGRAAFAAEDVTSTLAAVLKETPDPAALPADLPASLKRVLRRCLEKDPRERLSAIRDARLELDEPPETPVARAAAPARTPIASILTAALVGGLLVAAVMWLLPGTGRVAAPAGPVRASLVAPAEQELYPDAAAPALSPDGRYLAFVTGGDVTHGRQLWVRATGDLTPRLIAGTGGDAYLPFWSPDGRRLGFFSEGKLKTVALEGGRVNVVCAAADGRGGTWNTDDVMLFAPTITGPILRVSANGGDAAPVTSLDAARNETGHRFPVFLPDGDHFLFAVLPGKAGKFDIGIGSLKTGSRQPLGAFESRPVSAPSGHLLFMRRGVLVAQAFDEKSRTLSGEPIPIDDAPGGVGFNWTGGPAVTTSSTGLLAYFTEPAVKSRLVWLDVTGKDAGKIDVPAANYREIVIAPDGKHAAVVREESPTQSTVWLVDLTRGAMTPITAPGKHLGVTWSSDSKRIYFSSDREGLQQIFEKRVDDAAPEEAVFRSPALFKQPLSASPDGAWLLFWVLTPEAGRDLWMVPVSGNDRTPKPFIATPADQEIAKISPDGHWLAYTSNDTGRFEVWVQPFPSPGARVQVTTTGANGVWWRQDSRQLIVLADDGPKYVDVAPGSEFKIAGTRPVPIAPALSRILTADISGDFTRVLAATVGERDATRGSLTLVTDWASALTKK